MKTLRWFGVLAAALLASCADYGAPDEVVYGTAVYTQQKPGYDFKPLTSYYLDPTANVMDDANSTTIDVPASTLSTIDTNMQRLGYTKASQLTGANVGIKLSLLKGSAAVYYPGYWCGYWYYYYCSYDWYYGGSYEYGTVIMQMGDLSQPPSSTNGKLDVLWLSALYGVSSTASWNVDRVNDAVNRAFAQSPYLDTH